VILGYVIDIIDHRSLQVAKLSQRDRAAGCLSFGKNTRAKSVHLTSLYPTALTPTNDHFTGLFWLRNLGWFLKVQWQHCRALCHLVDSTHKSC